MRGRLVVAVAVATLAVFPASAFATQIVLPGVEERVVEGHTVFSLIEKGRFGNRTREAAAVAVLVREDFRIRNNFLGVLWFNDQFLVSPTAGGKSEIRHPCGGAIIIVNTGDPDPRWFKPGGLLTGSVVDGLAYGAAPPVGDFGFPKRVPDPRPPSPPLDGGDFEGDPLRDLPRLPDEDLFETDATAVFHYNESYRVTDPNDNAFTIDKYTMVVNDPPAVSSPVVPPTWTGSYPVWVVNLQGGTRFRADNGNSKCSPYTDDPQTQTRYTSQFYSRDVQVCRTTTTGTLANRVPKSCPSHEPGLGADTNGDGVPVDGLDMKPPAIGYYEPTDPATNGGASYCYDGNSRQGDNAGRARGSGCTHGSRPGTNRLRQYNALVYFFLGPEDVRTVGPAKPHGDTDTNGCESTLTFNDGTQKPPTEWICPDVDGDGVPDDDAEGNSHPFNPPGIYVPRAWDPVTGNVVAGTGFWVDVWSWNRECSTGYLYYQETALELEDQKRSACRPEEHAEHNRGFVDIHFSADWRPAEPTARRYVVFDEEGEWDQFHENNGPQPRTHPGQKDFDPLSNRDFAYATNPYP